MGRIIWVITTSLVAANFEERRREYEDCIGQLYRILPYTRESKIYILENNGRRETFLDQYVENPYGIETEIFYTNHNSISTENRGKKELLDISFFLECKKGEFSEDDLIVKLTGRYRLSPDSPFLAAIYGEASDRYDAFYRAGALMGANERMEKRDKYDSITGLFAIRYKFMADEINYFVGKMTEEIWVEWIIAMIIQSRVPKEAIREFDFLGIWIKTAYMKDYQLY